MSVVIALDLDGTLEDSRADMVAAIQAVRTQLGLGFRPDEALVPWVSQGMDALYLNAFDDYGVGQDRARYEAVLTLYENTYLANVATHTRLYPGIREAIEDLYELGHLAVVTNKPEHISRALLQALGVARFFGTVVGGDTCELPKPSPIPLRHAVKQLNGTRVVMVGDSAGDVKMGRACDALTIWCRWGYVDQIKETPDFTADTPADLARILQDALSRP